MTTHVRTTPEFEKAVKRLQRKYPSIKTELKLLITQLESNQHPGDKIPNIGHDVYKVRMKNTSAQRGKSGGFRVIYYIQVADTVLLLTAYSKTEQTDISAAAIQKIIQGILPPDDSDEGDD